MSIYIVDAVRTARGRGNQKSSLKDLRAVALGSQVFSAMRERQAFDTARVADAVLGCATQRGDQGTNIARLAALHAGWSATMNAVTINRACASGLSAVVMAGLMAQHAEALAVGGGVEAMSRVPMGSDEGPLFMDRALQLEIPLPPLGLSVDALATLHGISRAECDAYAAESQRRAMQAREERRYTSLIPVRGTSGDVLLSEDETPRPGTTAEALAAMEPAFAALGAKGLDAMLAQRLGLTHIDHVHHAGNSPATADGASLVLLASEAALSSEGLKPRARIVAMAELGSSPVTALDGCIEVSRLALKRAGLSVNDIDLFEVNEAFAATMVLYMRALGVPHERLNVNGGAIALGHAMGSTGSALVGTVLDELERRAQRRALVAVSGAVGVATAIIIERTAA